MSPEAKTQKITYENFVEALTDFLNETVGSEWHFNFEHDSNALFVQLNVDEDALDWGVDNYWDDNEEETNT